MDIMYQKHNCCVWHGGMEGFQSTNNQQNASTTLLPEIEYFFSLKETATSFNVRFCIWCGPQSAKYGILQL